VIYGMVKKL